MNKLLKGLPIAAPYNPGQNRNRPPLKKDEHRINHLINVPQVRLIGPDGEQIGVVNTREAIRMAEDAGLDLVEIAATSSPPVCKILDYGKFRFEQQKKQNAAKKKQQTITIKEITMRPGTEEHDYQVKLRKIKEFLEDGDKVKVTLRYRGREMAHMEIGMEQIKRIKADVDGLAKVESEPKLEGRHMHMMLSPTKTKS